MRKRIFTILCICMLLAISIAGFVGCVGGEIILPQPSPSVPDPSTPGKPSEPTQVTFYFSPITYNGARYNGEVNTYIADLKANVKVSEGTCMATITIKAVNITLMIDGVAQEPRAATAEELKKFTLTNATVKNVTTVDTEVAVKVRFGDFSAPMYYGASFNFELQADPYTVE